MAMEDGERDDWYADSGVIAFPGWSSRRAEKAMRKWRKNLRKFASDISLLRGGLVKEEKETKRCQMNRRTRGSMVDTTDTWPHHGYPNVTVNITVPTLLDDHSLRFIVGKPKKSSHALPEPHAADSGDHTTVWPPLVRSYVFVNGQATGPEAVARNGAVYMIPRLLRPYKFSRHDKGDDDNGEEEKNDWDDWEDWLPAWGEQ